MLPLLPRHPRAPKALPWLVLAAHVVTLLLIAQALRPHARGNAKAMTRPLWLRLVPEADRPATRVPWPAPAPAPPRAESRPGLAGSPDRQPPTPAPSPAPAAEAITPPRAEPPPAARAPEPPSSSPLDLSLPPTPRQAPPGAAAMAREDPRANTARLGSEERMARTLGTDLTLRESVDPDGTRTFRRGRDCVVARPARESQLNPFNQGTRPTPRLLEKC